MTQTRIRRRHGAADGWVAAPMRTGGPRALLGAYGPPALVLVLILAVWELACRLLGVPDYLLVAPTEVIATLIDRWPDALGSATAVTTQEMALGLVFSVVLAFFIAIGLHVSATARRAIYPLLIASQSVPVVVIAPVMAIVFGYTITPKVLVVGLLCFFPVVVGLLDGLSSVDPQLVRMMRTLYGSRWSTFLRVELPSALPSAFSGLRVAATYAPIGAVFGEYSGAEDGLGFLMIQAIPQLETGLVFASILVLTAESIALFLAVSLVERLICPWAREGKN